MTAIWPTVRNWQCRCGAWHSARPGYERATVERIEAAEAAPESFDAVAALRRVLEAADEIHTRGTSEVAAMDDEPDEYRKNQCASRAATYARAEHLIRRALDGTP